MQVLEEIQLTPIQVVVGPPPDATTTATSAAAASKSAKEGATDSTASTASATSSPEVTTKDSNAKYTVYSKPVKTETAHGTENYLLYDPKKEILLDPIFNALNTERFRKFVGFKLAVLEIASNEAFLLRDFRMLRMIQASISDLAIAFKGKETIVKARSRQGKVRVLPLTKQILSTY